VIGVAALAVISARSVVERRQQIGVLRAIGFQREMVQRSFLLESSFITLIAIVVGTALGLIIARNVVADAAESPSWANLHLTVPWAALVVIFVAVYAAGLLTTWAPARRAARVYSAAALRTSSGRMRTSLGVMGRDGRAGRSRSSVATRRRGRDRSIGSGRRRTGRVPSGTDR
jgi:ABC-type lipoprotein release transport system permease subunit